jgi:Zn-dependent peptidase ImmA (M78 family)
MAMQSEQLQSDNPLPSLRRRFIEESAAKLVAIYTTPPIPVLEIAEQNGVEVVFSDFGRHESVASGFCHFKDKKIYVNDSDIFARKVFTIAHELGHWILHQDTFLKDPDKYAVLPRFQKARSDIFEQEANLFAAELLVPKRLLLPVKSASVAQLAKIFGVSRAMMENRLKNVRTFSK